VYPQSLVHDPQSSNQPVTRLAPSPTGALHLGNAFAFVVNWAIARKSNWQIALRIEDLDTPRVKPGVIEQTITVLESLGLDWDSGPFTQSDQRTRYLDAMQNLAEQRKVYPCELTRTQIEEAATAPHEEPSRHEDLHDTRFHPSLRPYQIPISFDNFSTNWRFIVNPGIVSYTDQHMGYQSFDINQLLGDFVVWTKRQTPSYQLAVVVDDSISGVTHIVRGNDLLNSAARQLLLYRALGIEKEPLYTHLPLIRGWDGRRLAKRHGDTRIEHYTSTGTPIERIIGLIAFWSKITHQRAPMSLEEFKDGFSLDTLPKDDIVFTPEDDAWLRS
jgi:glutamyl-tRNA synthetase